MKAASLLVAHPWMSRGGSEATAMWTLEALSRDFRLSLVSAATLNASDWEELNQTYGTRVDPSRIQQIQAPRLPGVQGPHRLSHLQIRYFERHCRRLAPGFDLCLSAYNPIPFGRPGIQLMGDFSFSEDMRRRLNALGQEPLRHRGTFLRRLYLKAGEWLGGPSLPLRERGDLVLANSAWTAQQLQAHFGLEKVELLYPPVPLPSAPARLERDPWSFVSLGRISPEKEIERMVAILRGVRDRGFPVNFTIVGDFDSSPYARSLSTLIEPHRDWIRTPGFLHGEEKQQVLASHAFALHACRIEAFGIAVAEMAAMGCVPFVPSGSGAAEIVPYPELQFADEDEAVTKIIALLRQPEHVEALAQAMPNQVVRFAPARFAERLRCFVLDFLSAPAQRAHEAAS